MPITVQDVSRRGFLQWSLGIGAALALPKIVSAGLPMSLTEFTSSTAAAAAAKPIVAAPGAGPVYEHVALISDIHVSGGLLPGSMAKRLATAVQQVLSLDNPVQKVLVAGDCAHLSGNQEDYEHYIRGIQPLADAGLPIHMTLGNHDHRDHFWEALPAELAESNARLKRQSMVVPGKRVNWIMLDSLNKTNTDAGELGADQRDWLAAELDARKNKPAFVMLHHDLFRDGGKRGTLKDADKLLDIVRPRRQVKALFWGHTHVWDVSEDKSGIHMINLPATGYTLWGKSFIGWTACRVYEDSAFLQLHTIEPDGPENGNRATLKFRV